MKCPSEVVAPVLVIDTGPLIALTMVSLLPLLLSLFDRICIPHSVAAELQLDGNRPDAVALKAFLKNNRSLQLQAAKAISDRLSDMLDEGEAEAIALATELDAVLLIDEKRGRAVAHQWNVPIIGTGRLLVAAKKRGYLECVRPAIEELRKVGYRLADAIVEQIMVEAGE